MSVYKQKKRAPEILIIEDEYDIADLISLHLSDQHYVTSIARDGEQGLELALSKNWDLIILDLRLPGIDGLEICKQVRQNMQYIPILMLTSKSSELDRVLGLELGADDYMTKPFSILELVARVKAIFRRVNSLQARLVPNPVSSKLSLGSIEINEEAREVSVAENNLDLTAKEFELLVHFVKHPGKVFRRSELLNKVWGYGHEGYEHTVNSHINRLRSKIETDPAKPKHIVTVWGVGYKMESPSQNT